LLVGLLVVEEGQMVVAEVVLVVILQHLVLLREEVQISLKLLLPQRLLELLLVLVEQDKVLRLMVQMAQTLLFLV
jgi:hypothetical protein